MGLVAAIDGKPRREVIDLALKALKATWKEPAAEPLQPTPVVRREGAKHLPDLDLSQSPRQIDAGDRMVDVIASLNQPRVVVVPPSRHRPLYPDPFPQAGTPQPPPRLTQCGDFRCTDNLGNTYPRTGPGRFPGPGGVCRSNGGQAPC